MDDIWKLISDFEVSSLPGSDRQIMEQVASSVDGILVGEALERLKTAVSESALNAIEHGNHYQPELLVKVQTLISDRAVEVRITDQGSGEQIPESTSPNIEAKLAGLEKPRGWGMFLIRNMVDEMRIMNDANHHTLELIFYRENNEDEQ